MCHDPVIYRNRQQNNIIPSLHTVYKSPVQTDRHKIVLNLEEFQLFNSHNKIKYSITSTIFSTNESVCARFMRAICAYASCTCILLIFLNYMMMPVCVVKKKRICQFLVLKFSFIVTFSFDASIQYFYISLYRLKWKANQALLICVLTHNNTRK